MAEFATGLVSSSTKEKPSDTADDSTDNPDYVPDSQESKDDKFDDDEEVLLCDEDEVI